MLEPNTTSSYDRDIRASKLGRIPLIGALVLFITAVFSTGFHHWDEHFQVLEFAGWKSGSTPVQDLPWEFAARIRPAIQPFIAVQVHHLFRLFGSADPFAIALFLRVLSALLSFTAIMLMLRAFLPTITDTRLRRWYWLLSFFLWFAVYDAVRFSSENWSGCLFMVGFALLARRISGSAAPKFFIAGLFFGLAFTVRMQTALMIAGFLAWLVFIQREKMINLLVIVGGALVSVAIGICMDRWFYGQWTLTVFNYFDVNMLQGRADAFGTEPWYAYIIDTIVVTLPPFSLVFVIAPLVLLFYAPKNVLVWIFVPFILVHSLIGHKELRFLFPIVGLLPIVVIEAITVIRTKWILGLLDRRAFLVTTSIFGVVNLIMLGVIMLKPADAQIALYKTIYDGYPDPITLYHFGDDPYHRVERIHYYRRPGLEVGGMVTDTTLIPHDHPFLVATKHPPDVLMRWPDHKLIFASLPDRVKHFNFNGWLERTDQWYIYEVEI